MRFIPGKHLILSLLCVAGPSLLAQQDSSQIRHDQEVTFIQEKHSPKKAMLLSAVLPGAGQVYNKKWWKVPVIYAGIGAFGYFIHVNNQNYKEYSLAYNLASDTSASTYLEPYKNVPATFLKARRDESHKWRDLNIILMVGWYALNIIDANVDAHLYSFRNEDMSLRLDPGFMRTYDARTVPGLSLRVDF